MKGGAGAAQVIAGGIAVILVIVALPFIWLYEHVGGPLFFAIVLGTPTAIWWVADWRKGKAAAAKQRTTQATKDGLSALSFEPTSYKTPKPAVVAAKQLDEVHDQVLDAVRSRVHVIDADGEISIDWHRQFEEIINAWGNGDYDFARNWLQKLAYRLKSENAPEAVHARFKALMADFTRDDPLYADVMLVALPVIAKQPGVIQSNLAKQFPQLDAEQFRYAMYYGEVIGDVIREKKGRSYALRLPTA